MKKHSRNKCSTIHLENDHQGCMRNILHILNYHQWRHVKKRLPYKTHWRGGRNSTGSGKSGISSHAGNSDQGENSGVGESTHKNSVKARLKALIIEEKLKRKVQHQRSSTSPAHLQSPAPIDSSLPFEFRETGCRDQIPLNNVTSPRSILHQKNGSFIAAIPDGPSTSHGLEDGLNGLDQPAHGLVNINEELLHKILQERRKFTPQRFHSHKHSCSKIRLERSGTFPAPNFMDGMENNITNEGTQSKADANLTFTPVALPKVKDQGENNPTVIRRFRDIKDKIKHVAETNRKEKQRIVMDGVLDKIPNDDQRVSKEKKEELIRKWRECVINKEYRNSPRSEEKRGLKRVSSLDNLMDRYSQLYETTSFRREARYDVSDRLKVPEKEEPGMQAEIENRSLGRILSLPNLKSHSCRNENSASDAHLEDVQTRQKPEGNIGSIVVENSELAGISSQCSNHLEAEKDIEPTLEYSVGVMEVASVPTFDIGSHEIVLPSTETLLSVSKDSESYLKPDGNNGLEDTELPEDERHGDFLRVQVDVKDVELFNYVRDVLEVSGLVGPEPPEVWHSEDQPLSPSVYEELEGCMFMDPECSRNEDGGGDCDHLLLFDLINEVLVDMYQQSLSYWPEPLSRHCRIHRMPVGPHLLKEVWSNVSTYLSYKPELDLTLDHVASRDLERRDGWMDLQFESECTGIEIEDLIFEELLEELLID